MAGPPFFTPGMGPGPVSPPLRLSTPIRTVPREWLVRGYTEAFDRFRDASQHPDSPEGLFVPLFEALNWAGALEEKLRPHTDPLLWAIRWVRNTVLHHWADAVEGRNVPNAYIAKPGASGPIPPAVDTHLSGKPVRLGLADLRQMF